MGPDSGCGDSILCVVNVKKYFGGVRAVDGVTLSIKRAGIYGLIGPNGSGKTTLFNVIAGIYKPDSGDVWLDGERITGMPPHEVYKRGLIRTFQTPRLWESLTVFENTLTSSRRHPGDSLLRSILRRLWRHREIMDSHKSLDSIDLVGISQVAGNRATDISGGQMKLSELARALNSSPKVVLLDEPAAGINPTLARSIFDKIVEYREKLGLTFFIIEHRLEILFDYVDYVYVMHQGRIISQGKPEEVASDERVVKVYLEG